MSNSDFEMHPVDEYNDVTTKYLLNSITEDLKKRIYFRTPLLNMREKFSENNVIEQHIYTYRVLNPRNITDSDIVEIINGINIHHINTKINIDSITISPDNVITICYSTQSCDSVLQECSNSNYWTTQIKSHLRKKCVFIVSNEDIDMELCCREVISVKTQEFDDFPSDLEYRLQLYSLDSFIPDSYLEYFAEVMCKKSPNIVSDIKLYVELNKTDKCVYFVCTFLMPKKINKLFS